jgi:hypothetical protein
MMLSPRRHIIEKTITYIPTIPSNEHDKSIERGVVINNEHIVLRGELANHELHARSLTGEFKLNVFADETYEPDYARKCLIVRKTSPDSDVIVWTGE